MLWPLRLRKLFWLRASRCQFVLEPPHLPSDRHFGREPFHAARAVETHNALRAFQDILRIFGFADRTAVADDKNIIPFGAGRVVDALDLADTRIEGLRRLGADQAFR